MRRSFKIRIVFSIFLCLIYIIQTTEGQSLSKSNDDLRTSKQFNEYLAQISKNGSETNTLLAQYLLANEENKDTLDRESKSKEAITEVSKGNDHATDEYGNIINAEESIRNSDIHGIDTLGHNKNEESETERDTPISIKSVLWTEKKRDKSNEHASENGLELESTYNNYEPKNEKHSGQIVKDKNPLLEENTANDVKLILPENKSKDGLSNSETNTQDKEPRSEEITEDIIRVEEEATQQNETVVSEANEENNGFEGKPTEQNEKFIASITEKPDPGQHDGNGRNSKQTDILPASVTNTNSNLKQNTTGDKDIYVETPNISEEGGKEIIRTVNYLETNSSKHIERGIEVSIVNYDKDIESKIENNHNNKADDFGTSLTPLNEKETTRRTANTDITEHIQRDITISANVLTTQSSMDIASNTLNTISETDKGKTEHNQLEKQSHQTTLYAGTYTLLDTREEHIAMESGYPSNTGEDKIETETAKTNNPSTKSGYDGVDNITTTELVEIYTTSKATSYNEPGITLPLSSTEESSSTIPPIASTQKGSMSIQNRKTSSNLFKFRESVSGRDKNRDTTSVTEIVSKKLTHKGRLRPIPTVKEMLNNDEETDEKLSIELSRKPPCDSIISNGNYDQTAVVGAAVGGVFIGGFVVFALFYFKQKCKKYLNGDYRRVPVEYDFELNPRLKNHTF